MASINKLFDTIDKKAFFVTIIIVTLFIIYISIFGGRGIVDGLKALASKSHSSSDSPDIFCAKKGNSKTAFCSDRRAAKNEHWKEVTSNGSASKKGAFRLTK